MSEKFRVKLSCPDCGSEQFIFSAEPHTIDNVESCASCGRAISKKRCLSPRQGFPRRYAQGQTEGNQI
ncbi:ECs_2282 family putative zinc-binding protein [Klebsiella oxytoca]